MFYEDEEFKQFMTMIALIGVFVTVIIYRVAACAEVVERIPK